MKPCRVESWCYGGRSLYGVTQGVHVQVLVDNAIDVFHDGQEVGVNNLDEITFQLFKKIARKLLDKYPCE
jgi:hypothetical protein